MPLPKIKFSGALSALDRLFQSKAPPLIGMDISSTAVKMVELSDTGNKMYRIERYAIEPLPRDSVVEGNINNLDAVGEAVKRCHSRLGSSIKNVALALPNAAVITKKILVPAGLTEEEIEVQVEAEAHQYIPFSLDEVNLDFSGDRPCAWRCGRCRSVDRRLAQGKGRRSCRGHRSRRAQGCCS